MYDFLKAGDIASLSKFVPQTREEYLKHIQTVYNLKLHTPFPLVVHIETTNYCNQKCIMCCHPTMRRKPINIDENLAYKAIDECSRMNPWFMHFFFFGEPFINKKTLDYMKYAKKVGVKNVATTTNLTIIKKHEIEELVNSQIDSLHVSCEGLDRESYKKIRKTDHFDKVNENLDYRLAYRDKRKSAKPWVSLTFVRTTETDSQISEFESKWSSRVNALHISPQFEYRNGSPVTSNNPTIKSKVAYEYGDRRQEIRSKQDERNDGNIMFTKPEDRVPCRQLWARMVVLANGELVPCSQNIDGELSLGNIKDTTINDAWTGKEMSELRMQHISNNYSGLRGNACKVCTDWDWSGKTDNRPEVKS